MANSAAILNNLSTKLKLPLVYDYEMIGNLVEIKFQATCFFNNHKFKAVGGNKKLAKVAVSKIVLEKFSGLGNLDDLPQLPAAFSEVVEPADLLQLPATFSEVVEAADLPQLPATFSEPVKPADLPQLSVPLPDSPLCLNRKLSATSSMPSSSFIDDDDGKPPIKKRKLNYNEKQKELLKTAKKLSDKIAKTTDSLNMVLSQLISK